MNRRPEADISRRSRLCLSDPDAAAMKAEYLASGGMRSNTRYGYVHKATT